MFLLTFTQYKDHTLCDISQYMSLGYHSNSSRDLLCNGGSLAVVLSGSSTSSERTREIFLNGNCLKTLFVLHEAFLHMQMDKLIGNNLPEKKHV